MPEMQMIDYQTEESWLKARMKSIGASESAAIMGESRYADQYEIYCRKVGESLDQADPERFEWGHRMEPVIAAKYADETSYTVTDPGEYVVFNRIDMPFMTATLDRLIAPGDDPRGWGALELKNVQGFMADDWAEDAPREYWCQLQHQMYVTGMTWGVIACLIGGCKYVAYEYEWDEDYIADLQQVCADFWGRVESQTPPDPGSGRNTGKLLQQVYPVDTEADVLELDADWDRWLPERVLLANEVKSHQSRKTEIENLLKFQLGHCARGVTPMGWKVNWFQKSNGRSLRVTRPKKTEG